jgi:hypothetical protein
MALSNLYCSNLILIYTLFFLFALWAESSDNDITAFESIAVRYTSARRLYCLKSFCGCSIFLNQGSAYAT